MKYIFNEISRMLFIMIFGISFAVIEHEEGKQSKYNFNIKI
jgi:hypothetical protein